MSNDSWQVIVCRPYEKGFELTELLKEHSIEAISSPLITIELGLEIHKLAKTLTNLKKGALVFLLSPNIFLFKKLLTPTESTQITAAFNDEFNYFSIGRSTADKFYEQVGLRAHFPLDHEISETLIALTPLNRLINDMRSDSNKQALLIRGNGGRDVISNYLNYNAYSVTEIEAYRRIENQAGLTQCKESIAQHKNTIIVITSAEMLVSLNKSVAKESEYFKNKALNSIVIVVSERIKLLANELGFNKVIVAKKANNHALMVSILEVLQNVKN